MAPLRFAPWILVASLTLESLAVVASSNRAQQAVNDLPNPYQSIDNHFKLSEGRWWESASGIDVDVDGRSIWIADRCAGDSCTDSRLNPILQFDQSGNLVKRFGEKMFNLPHGIHVDRSGAVWVTDAKGPEARKPKSQGKGHTVYKFAADGRLLLTLGIPGVAGDGRSGLLNEPSDVVTAPNGDVFVADGHGRRGNAVPRIAKFTKDGRFLTSWGGFGWRPGEFVTPHGLAMDSRGRLFVADPGNNRIQIFDQQGTFIAEWKQFGRAKGIFISPDDTLYVADSESADESNPGWKRGIRIGSARDGSVRYFIPEATGEQGRRSGAEGVAADASGGVYGAAVGGGALALKKYARP